MQLKERDAVGYLRDFTNAHGASGAEGEVAALLRSALNEWGAESGDRIGSVAYSKGGGTKVMVAAHMDEVGFRVQHIDERGFIKFVNVGGWWGHTLLAQQVVIKTQSGEKVLGVIGSKPVHFLPQSERSKVLDLKSMYVDIGAISRAEVFSLGIQLGDAIVPATQFTALGTPGRVMAKAFDNRVGCAALPQVAALLPDGLEAAELILAATVQEEVGTRGARTLVNVVQPDYAIVLEGSPADDTVGFSPSESQATLGKGVQIRMHDPSAIMSPYLTNLAVQVAQKEGIPYQLAVRTSGGTDAQAFSYSREGVPSIVLGVPARYIHTHNSLIDLADYMAMVKLAAALAKAVAENEKTKPA